MSSVSDKVGKAATDRLLPSEIAIAGFSVPTDSIIDESQRQSIAHTISEFWETYIMSWARPFIQSVLDFFQSWINPNGHAAYKAIKTEVQTAGTVQRSVDEALHGLGDIGNGLHTQLVKNATNTLLGAKLDVGGIAKAEKEMFDSTYKLALDHLQSRFGRVGDVEETNKQLATSIATSMQSGVKTYLQTVLDTKETIAASAGKSGQKPTAAIINALTDVHLSFPELDRQGLAAVAALKGVTSAQQARKQALEVVKGKLLADIETDHADLTPQQKEQIASMVAAGGVDPKDADKLTKVLNADGWKKVADKSPTAIRLEEHDEDTDVQLTLPGGKSHSFTVSAGK